MIRFGVLTVSDRSFSGERQDSSGPVIIQEIDSRGDVTVRTGLVPDELEQIARLLKVWCDQDDLDVILTTGGTGFSPRDITPEATFSILDRIAPGISEALRSASLAITPHAMLSRGISGIRGRTLIVNLPGNPRAVRENLLTLFPVLPHAVQILRSDPSGETGHLSSMNR